MLTARERLSIAFQREVIARAQETATTEMEMYKIEDGIDIPKRVRPTGAGRKAKYPFAILGVGQSFLVPAGPYKDLTYRKAVCRLTASSAAWGKKLSGRKFSVRTVEGGVRVWRVE